MTVTPNDIFNSERVYELCLGAMDWKTNLDPLHDVPEDRYLKAHIGLSPIGFDVIGGGFASL